MFSARKQKLDVPPVRSGRSWVSRIALPVAILIAFMVIAAAGYAQIQPEYSALDAAYMTVITITSLGGQVGTLSEAGRVWTMFVVIGGLIIGAVVLSSIVAIIVEGQVRKVLGRRQLQRRIAALCGHVIVCGYGRMGAIVVEQLTAASQDVVVVDNDPERTAIAERAGLLYVLGDAEDEGVLAQAGLDRAAVLVTTLATDAANVFVTLSARQENEELRIIARAQQATSQSKLLKAGALRVICPQIIGATRVADVVLRPAVVDFVEMAHKGVELEMDQLSLSAQSRLTGKTLEELELPRRTGTHVVAVSHAGGETTYHPTPDLRLVAGDTLVLIGRRGAATAIEKLQLESGCSNL
jgi:voltage-gated potassium channel